MPGRYDNRWQRFAPSRPIPVEDGLTTSKQRGAMADEWWSQQFVEVLESYGMEARMQRGRRYARTGQVISLEVEPGLVAAQVQGSRPTPYLVSIRLPEMSDDQWDAVDARLGDDLGTVATMLSGEVPPSLVDVFADAGVDLFPRRWNDLRASCNCPDPEAPCKHLAAVLYILADRLEQDPWLLLAWRGRTRDQVLELLRRLDTEDPEPRVAPWWPFASGRIPDDVRFAESRAGLDATGDDPAAVLSRLDDLDVEVLDSTALALVAKAYPVLQRTVSVAR